MVGGNEMQGVRTHQLNPLKDNYLIEYKEIVNNKQG
jgi:hypothetical protein